MYGFYFREIIGFYGPDAFNTHLNGDEEDGEEEKKTFLQGFFFYSPYLSDTHISLSQACLLL